MNWTIISYLILNFNLRGYDKYPVFYELPLLQMQPFFSPPAETRFFPFEFPKVHMWRKMIMIAIYNLFINLQVCWYGTLHIYFIDTRSQNSGVKPGKKRAIGVKKVQTSVWLSKSFQRHHWYCILIPLCRFVEGFGRNTVMRDNLRPRPGSVLWSLLPQDFQPISSLRWFLWP